MNINGTLYRFDGLINLGANTRRETKQICWAYLVGPRGASYYLQCFEPRKGYATAILTAMADGRTVAIEPEIN